MSAALLGVVDPATLDPTTILLLIGAGMATVILQAVGNRRTGKVMTRTEPLANGFKQEWKDLQATVAAMTDTLGHVEGLLTSHLAEHQSAMDPPAPTRLPKRLDEPA